MSEALIAKPLGNNMSLPMLAWKLLVATLRLVGQVVLSPVRLFLAIRRSMTAASVAVLLVSIMTLNIIWGYPWTGMFAACTSLLFVGFGVNYWLRPRLRIEFSLAAQSPAGQLCDVVMHCTSIGRLPALDFQIEHAGKKSQHSGSAIESSAGVFVRVIRPGERLDIVSTLVFPQRGIQSMPATEITTTFPFHLFRSKRAIASEATIAVTPAPLCGDEDATARSLLNAVGGWSHKLLAGDALDYTGSREYQAGMPVRRWDFPSWARLGRPIVREYQAPSVPTVLLIVDTAITVVSGRDDQQQYDLIERALSLAATTINDLVNKSVRIQMYVTSEAPPDAEDEAKFQRGSSDVESLLIRLAAAEYVQPSIADQRIQQFLCQGSGEPTLLLTARQHADVFDDLAGRAHIVSVDQGEWPAQGATERDRAYRVDRPHQDGSESKQPGPGSLVASGDRP